MFPRQMYWGNIRNRKIPRIILLAAQLVGISRAKGDTNQENIKLFDCGGQFAIARDLRLHFLVVAHACM